MSAQTLDLKRSVRIVLRHKILVGVAAGLGLLGGVAYAVLRPPMVTSQALVVLPPSVNGFTQVVVADSDPVLAAALPSVDRGMSLDGLRSRVQVKRVTSNILSVNAQGRTAAQAENAANAVTASYLAYIGSAHSPVGQVQARVLERASSATGKSLAGRVVDTAGPGVLAGALIGVLIALALGRNDRRLRERDQIADSLGIPVLASIPVARPSDAVGWANLFEKYEPGALDAWRLRKALHQLGAVGVNVADLRAGSGSSLAVLSLSADRHAVALGPQLAVFAASLGVPTALVVGPQQDANVTATLRAACAAAPGPVGKSGNLYVSVSDDHDASHLPRHVLTIAVAVVDGVNPRVAGTMRATTTVLGVSAGAATAEELARVAASAAADRRDIAGILVADPDPADQSTGRLPQLARPAQRRTPTRMTIAATETRR